MSRVINYNTEQEANKYIKKKIYDNYSRYQNKTIPIPRFHNPNNQNMLIRLNFDCDIQMISNNFMGRLMESLLFLTDSVKTIYASEYATWYLYNTSTESTSNSNMFIKQNKHKMITTEICGLKMFTLLDRAIGTIGMRGKYIYI